MVFFSSLRQRKKGMIIQILLSRKFSFLKIIFIGYCLVKKYYKHIVWSLQYTIIWRNNKYCSHELIFWWYSQRLDFHLYFIFVGFSGYLYILYLLWKKCLLKSFINFVFGLIVFYYWVIRVLNIFYSFSRLLWLFWVSCISVWLLCRF